MSILIKKGALRDTSDTFQRVHEDQPLSSNPGGGGVTIYTGDGALGGDRIINLNGHTLQFQDGNNVMIYINPSTFQADYGATNGESYAKTVCVSDVDGNNISAKLWANNAINDVYVEANATEGIVEIVAPNGLETSKLSTDGNNFWEFNQAEVETVTPDNVLIVAINGQFFKIPALLFND